MNNLLDFNDNWQFHFGEIDFTKNENVDFKTIRLPHDWSVEFPFNKEKGGACTGYLLGGTGWYKKAFETTKEMTDGNTFINFDGMYERAEIYVNGNCITFHPYGYSPCTIDITPYLNKVNCNNEICVHIDHSRYANSRWYTGSGIYRKVNMYVVNKVYIPLWGIKVDTLSCDIDKASLTGKVEVLNTSKVNKAITVKAKCISPINEVVWAKNKNYPIREKEIITLNMDVSKPLLWDIYKGNKYKLEISIYENEKLIQTKTQDFGIRAFYFDTETGFYINGRNEHIKGVCLHHDAGAVGAAVPLDVWKRRLEELKGCGCNAIRTAHNPASNDFLKLCDDMGFLVQEEFYDEWDNPKDKRKNGQEKTVDYITRAYTEFFRDYGKADLQNVVHRDYNHPSIIMWSIGNEIEWTYTKYNDATGYFTEGKGGFWYWWNLPPYSKDQIAKNISKIPRNYYDIGSTAQKLSKWVKEIDVNRPVTANCILPTASYETGYADALDIMGYSYRSVIYDYGKENYPDKPILGTENVGQYREWKAVLEHPHISGIFLWTGIDHMGEAWVQKSWPRKGSNLGLLDFAGFHKPSYYMFKSLWTNENVIHIETQTLKKSLYNLENNTLVEKELGNWEHNDWHWQDVNPYWNYKENELVVIEVYSNLDSLTLYCNDNKISTLQLSDFKDHIYKWCIPYKEGTIKVCGTKAGKEIAQSLSTTYETTHLNISCDKTEITCSSDSVAHVTVSLLDSNNNAVKNIEDEITFTINGPGYILGIDNGNPDNVNFYKSNSITTWHGKALIYLAGTNTGTINVTACCKDFKNTLAIKCK